jgi:Tfp pilus assembly protein PilN
MQWSLAGSLMASCVALVWVLSAMNGIEAEQERLAARQASLRMATGAQEGGAETLVRARKAQDRSATLVLESLAGLMPDTTFLVSIDMAGDRLVAAGQSADANALIGLLERSGRFSDVRFIAPTTRDSAGAERFQVEARTMARRGPQ